MTPAAVVLLAAAAAEEVWVELRGPEDRARAEAAGLAWAEGQDGRWYRYAGSLDAARSAGLRARRGAAEAGWIPDPDTVEATIDAVAATGAAAVVDLGTSVEGRPIRALVFGEGPEAVRVLAGHHGDEGAAVVLALALAEALAADPSAVPAGRELWLVPAVNPDGLAAGLRTNANGVDLNRNYDVEWGAGSGGEAPFSEPETRAVRGLARARAFLGGLSLHAGAANLGWPWNHSAEDRAADEPLLRAIAEDYAARVGVPGFWVTNGADWYPTRGDENDWAYGRWGGFDYTLEVAVEKSPPREEAEAIAADHLPAVLAWIARPADLALEVVDAETGAALPATLEGGEGQPTPTGPDGRLARWVTGLEGWSLTAPGYAPGAPGDPALAPLGWRAVRPEPAAVHHGGRPLRLRLPGVDGGVATLSQPGEAPRLLLPVGPETWWLDPAALAPGAWTVTVGEVVLPRALLVGEGDDRVGLVAAERAGDTLAVEGYGFGAGTRAWGFVGPGRAPVDLDVTGDDTRLVVGPMAGVEDVLVWSAGAWLVVEAVASAPAVVVAGEAADAPEPALAAAGCAAAGGARGTWTAVLAACLAFGCRRPKAGASLSEPGTTPRRGRTWHREAPNETG